MTAGKRLLISPVICRVGHVPKRDGSHCNVAMPLLAVRPDSRTKMLHIPQDITDAILDHFSGCHGGHLEDLRLGFQFLPTAFTKAFISIYQDPYGTSIPLASSRRPGRQPEHVLRPTCEGCLSTSNYSHIQKFMFIRLFRSLNLEAEISACQQLLDLWAGSLEELTFGKHLLSYCSICSFFCYHTAY